MDDQPIRTGSSGPRHGINKPRSSSRARGRGPDGGSGPVPPGPGGVVTLRQLQLRANRRMVTAALTLLLVPSLWYVRTDLSLYRPEDPELLARLLVRVTLLLILCTGIVAMRSVESRESYSSASLWIALGVAGCLLAMNALRPHGAGLPLRSPLFTIALFYAAFPNRMGRQILPPVILTAALIVLRLTRLTGGVESDIAGDIVILLSLNTIGVLLVRQRVAMERDLAQSWRSEAVARVEAERAVDELSALRGIIPICSHCKQVRTEVGDWQQIEQYVSDHSAAHFSHGVCPSCLDRHYDSVSISAVETAVARTDSGDM